MTAKGRERRRSSSALGVVAAVILLVVTGTGYRLMAARLERTGKGLSLPPDALDGVPMHIGDWSGYEVPLDEVIIQRTDTDAHLSRTYVGRDGRTAVSVFVGCGVKVRDLMPHRPEVCYTGAGWTLEKTREIELTTADGLPLSCRILTFDRAGLDAQRVTVLNYYIVDGAYCPDVSLLRSKARRFSGEAAYVAQVQIAGRPGILGKTAEEPVRAFAAESAPELRQALTSAIREVRRHARAGGSTAKTVRMLDGN